MRLVCKERVVECREDRQIIAGQFLDAELAANKIPIKKSDPSSMPARSCRDVLSPAFRNTTKRDDAKRGDDLDRERKEKRERERERFEERKRKVRDRPTFLYLFF